MEAVLKIKEEKKTKVPSIVHVDQTCRLQSVEEKNNLKFHMLINCFYKITGVPLILNTSFNENEPIVNIPIEAIKCFERTNMDILVLENYVIARKE